MLIYLNGLRRKSFIEPDSSKEKCSRSRPFPFLSKSKGEREGSSSGGMAGSGSHLCIQATRPSVRPSALSTQSAFTRQLQGARRRHIAMGRSSEAARFGLRKNKIISLHLGISDEILKLPVLFVGLLGCNLSKNRKEEST